MSDIEPELLADIIAFLRDFPSNGKPADTDAYWGARVAGLIEEKEITKPCKNCGTPLTDYRYWKISAAGKVLLQALDAQVLA